MKQWKKEFAPECPEETPDDRFVTACFDLPYISSLLDVWFQPDKEQRQKLAQRVEPEDNPFV